MMREGQRSLKSILVAGMKWVLGVFSQGWNRRRSRRGHVFQGRYKAVDGRKQRKSWRRLDAVEEFGRQSLGFRLESDIER